MDEVFSLCFAGQTLDDALHHVTVDRDMLRHLLVEKPKVNARPPLKRPTPPAVPKLPGKEKRPRNGECWGWREGRCSNPLCKFKRECAKCGSKNHHSGECDQAKRVQ